MLVGPGVLVGAVVAVGSGVLLGAVLAVGSGMLVCAVFTGRAETWEAQLEYWLPL